MSISWEEELPVQELPRDPRWIENFCFDGYDHERDIGFWIHCGRWWRDHSIWREQVLVYWPGERYLVHRAWGFRPSQRGPSAALLDLICEEPGRAWRLRYRGPARPTFADELSAGPLPEAPVHLLDLDIGFTSDVPVWNMAGISGEQWGKFHIEQTGRFQGRIAFDDQAVEMDGLGWRDHSRGPRELSNMGRHCWIHGDLPGGRSFALTMIDNLAENGAFVRGLNKVVIWDGGELFEASCENPPFLESSATPPSVYEMRLEYEKGRVEIGAEVRRCLPHSTTRHMDCFDGVTPGQAHVVTYEQGTVFTVDGRRFNGHTERSYLLTP